MRIKLVLGWAHYLGASFPESDSIMDIEWAKDGITGELFIVQARPETVQSQRRKDILETYVLEKRSEILARGRSVGDKIASGKAHEAQIEKEQDKSFELFDSPSRSYK